ncbi:hypothetical protein B0F90DRAFT_826418 [Multifurca ochricompacta]|uniref:Fungal STAND N-terminal Goodbye domain-containing protein n=1 Tax=Multifurca ochricompacta TaxID=376703 RepID=A0AAD4M2N1_9AGAM|nr:hypothetical protein B0F90DRAFT_826418 [Multifurca ochricompacta]
MVFKELLSRPLAVLLHLSSCHLQPSDNLPQPPASQNVVPSTAPMSSPLPIIAPTSYLQSLFNVTLIKYSKETGIDLATHPLAATIDSCSSIGAVIVAIQEQTWPSAHTVFLLSPSAALKGNIDLGFPPAKAVFCGICVLLAAARDFDTNYVALVDLFGCVESFLRFLRIYTSIPPALVVIEKAMKILLDYVSQILMRSPPA